jgi:class 3 adenylate cyclase
VTRQTRTVTVLFTDVVGSTELLPALGPEAAEQLRHRHFGDMRGALAVHRGREVKTLGDGCLATFDGPARAIRCGWALASAARANDLEVRVGLHSGEVELMGSDVGGIAVHIAARVGELATAGEVLVSGTVKDLVAGSGIEFADRGTRALKGLPDEWRLLAAVCPPDDTSR